MNTNTSINFKTSKLNIKSAIQQNIGYSAIAIMAFLTIFSRIIKYLFNMMLARNLGDKIELYGDFFVGIYTVQILAFILLLGSSMSSIVFMGKYINLKKVDRAIAYTRWNLRMVSAMFSAFLLLFSMFIMCIIMLHLFHIYAFEKHSLVIHMICFVPFFAITTLLASYLLCNTHPYWYNFFLNGAIYFLGICMLLANAYFFKVSLKTMEALWFFSCLLLVIPALWAICVAFMKISKILIPSLNFFLLDTKYDWGKEDKGKEDKGKEDKWMRVSYKLIMQQLQLFILITVNLYVVELLPLDEAATGKYSAIITVGGTAFNLGITVCQLLSAKISTLVLKKAKEDLQNLINKINLTIFLISLVVTIAFCCFSKQILGTFGKNYTDVTVPFMVYSIMMFLAAITRFPGVITSFSNNEKYVTRIILLEVLILIISGIPLTYFFGLTGAALSFGVVIVFDAVAFTRIVRKKVGVKPLTFI